MSRAPDAHRSSDRTERRVASARALRSAMVVAARQVLDHARSSWVWSLIALAVSLTAFSTRVHVETIRTRTSIYQDLNAQRDRDRARASGQVSGWQVEQSLRA